jgi:hypothetical protein
MTDMNLEPSSEPEYISSGSKYFQARWGVLRVSMDDLQKRIWRMMSRRQAKRSSSMSKVGQIRGEFRGVRGGGGGAPGI